MHVFVGLGFIIDIVTVNIVLSWTLYCTMSNHLFFNSFFLQLVIAPSFSFLSFLCSIYECVPWTLAERNETFSVVRSMTQAEFAVILLIMDLCPSYPLQTWSSLSHMGTFLPIIWASSLMPFLSFFPRQMLVPMCMYVKARGQCHLRNNSLNLELINPAKLTEQRAPGSFCFLLPGAEIRSIARHAQFYCGSWWLNPGSLACASYGLIHDPIPVLCIFKQSQLKGITVHFCHRFILQNIHPFPLSLMVRQISVGHLPQVKLM